ncbi:MAG: type V CRISPR-associated protein Cas12b, partial [Planctomycetaceae bacterium]|nr:type V CRISPR-associated protein Cas12b [Planctomycetaceae bacterium]
VEAVDIDRAETLNHQVATGAEESSTRVEKVLGAFQNILRKKQIPDSEHESWMNSCRESLSAQIRDDAYWVDRTAAFNELVLRCDGKLTTEWSSRTFFDLIGGSDEYFKLNEEGADADGKDFVIKAGNWLSANWGAGDKSDPAAIAEALSRLSEAAAELSTGTTALDAMTALAAALDPTDDKPEDTAAAFKAIKKSVGWKGRPSKGAMALQRLMDSRTIDTALIDTVAAKLSEEAKDQQTKAETTLRPPEWMPHLRSEITSAIGMPYRVERDLIWEHAVLLDHALRRTSVAHSWIKRAEVERRQFRDDAAKLNNETKVPQAARNWLDSYCQQRAVESGSLGDFVIRKQAIDGWKRVVAEWNANPDWTEAERKQAVRDVQAELDRDEKWGDGRLFEDLAADDAVCVWQNANGTVAATILTDYSAATTARANQRRFKVPAYRHPDAMMNPVWIDFGNSRWNISYSALSEFDKRQKLQRKLATAKTDKARKKHTDALAAKPDLQSITLGLWSGTDIQNVSLKWQGKRLQQDLDLAHFNTDGPEVVRADRLNRAASGTPNNAVNVVGIFQQKDWNGRLQLKRPVLERLREKLRKAGISSDDPADWGGFRKHFDNLDWYLTTSAKLEPSGPFIDYLQRDLPDGWKYVEKTRYLSNDLNKAEKRSGRTRIQLARLPGLRVLSFDLGHRFGASCAVWETVSSDQLNSACKAAGVESPTGSDLFFVLEQPTDNGSKKPTHRRIVYRRLADDELNGKPHPAPWARLDRQFVIKLQGEDRPARRTTQQEFNRYNEFRRFLNLEELTAREERDLDGAVAKLPPITWLMQEAVRDARLGLRRHADRARIAHAMTAKAKHLSGNRTAPFSSDEERRDHIVRHLLLWNDLAKAAIPVGANIQRCPFAYQAWLDHIQPLVGENIEDCHNEDDTRPARKKKREALAKQLEAAANQIITDDSFATQLHHAWKDNWHSEDKHWISHLKWLRKDLLMPGIGRRPRNTQSSEFAAWQQRKKQLRNMGGLSYDRIGALRQLYQVMKAFRNRPMPDDPKAGVLDRHDSSQKNFGRRMLDQFEKLREQRVKQLASRVIEAALGLGAEPGRDQHGHDAKRQRTPSDDPRFAPCHAVIMENLRSYKTAETRMRRENRMLASWAYGTVRKYVEEACELHGVYFDDVPAQYTSKQDSRTMMPGVRCVEVDRAVLKAALSASSAADSMAGLALQKQSLVRRWKSEFSRCADRVQKRPKEASARDRLLSRIRAAVESDTDCLPNQVLLPVRGGDLFL